MIDVQSKKEYIEQYIVEERSRSDYAEIHTPFSLIDQMLDKFPEDVWSDPDKTWFDPCAGIGNFGICIVERLMEGLSDVIEDREERYRHIVENQLFQNDIQPKNVIEIVRIFNPEAKYNLNLKCADALKLNVPNMTPDDFKTEMFREVYDKTFNFFEYSPTPEEIERLHKTLELCENDVEREVVSKGYDVSVGA